MACQTWVPEELATNTCEIMRHRTSRRNDWRNDGSCYKDLSAFVQREDCKWAIKYGFMFIHKFRIPLLSKLSFLGDS
jgi:hypothetical protein